MALDKKDIINALNHSVNELEQGLKTHCCLVTSILEKQIDEGELQSIFDHCPKRSREISLEKAIKEAIEEIEESRKSFKSKRLETLRKKLTAVLIETD